MRAATSVACAVAKAAGPMPCALDRSAPQRLLALADGKALGPRIDGSSTACLTACRRGAAKPRWKSAPFSTSTASARAGSMPACSRRTMPQGARVAISGAADYWDAARATAATVVVDAPSLDRSQVGSRVARHGWWPPVLAPRRGSGGNRGGKRR
ncbi:MAG: hypothetical protein R3C16_11200 [Hyphomonadaceae bacterium]